MDMEPSARSPSSSSPVIFDPCYRERAYNDMLAQLTSLFPRHMRKADHEHVTQYTLLMIEQMPASQKDKTDNVTVLLTAEKPKDWTLLLRLRQDVPWRLVLIPKDLTVPECAQYEGQPAIVLVQRRLAVTRPTVLTFFLMAVAEAAHPIRPVYRSLLEFLFSMDPDPAFIQQLHTALGSEFFPVPSADTATGIPAIHSDLPGHPSLYTILQATHPKQFSQAAELMEWLDPRANRDGGQQDWTSIMDGKQQLFVAYSAEAMREAGEEKTGYPPLMGYLAASTLVSSDPRLVSLAVIPDAQRLGLASLLLRRYFAQTAVSRLIIKVPKLVLVGDVMKDSYHLLSFFQQCGAIVDKEALNAWRLILRNPLNKVL